jgi:hypothetical protein
VSHRSGTAEAAAKEEGTIPAKNIEDADDCNLEFICDLDTGTWLFGFFRGHNFCQGLFSAYIKSLQHCLTF